MQRKNWRFTCETDTSAHTAVRFNGQILDLFLQQQICRTVHDSISGSLTMWNVFIFFVNIWLSVVSRFFPSLKLSYHDIFQVFFFFGACFFLYFCLLTGEPSLLAMVILQILVCLSAWLASPMSCQFLHVNFKSILEFLLCILIFFFRNYISNFTSILLVSFMC